MMCGGRWGDVWREVGDVWREVGDVWGDVWREVRCGYGTYQVHHTI